MIKFTDSEKINIKSSSKGDQAKFQSGQFWYKIDSFGYEGLAESVATRLLEHSNINSFAKYSEERIEYNGVVFNGCKSENFLKEGEEIITAYRLYKDYFGASPSSILSKEESTEEKITKFVADVSEITGIQKKEIGNWLTKIVEFNALIANDDGHFNNLLFIYSNDNFRLGPVFDSGAGFLSDTTFRPIITNSEDEIYDYLEKIKSKPFSEDPAEQVQAIRMLYGPQLEINASIDDIIPNNSIYNERVLNRRRTAAEIQFDKYPEIFCSEKDKEYLDSMASEMRKVLSKTQNIEKEDIIFH